MPFGLGLGILFLSLYEGRAANKFGLLTGQIVSVGTVQLQVLAGAAVVVMLALVAIWRPLTFASVDPDVAAARGVPVRALALGFMLLLGVSVALSIQIVGALLVLALLITPAAAALRVTSSPRLVVLLSVVFAVTATVGGILLALGGRHPDQPLRHHDVVPDLRGLPGDRRSPCQARHQRAGAADERSRRPKRLDRRRLQQASRTEPGS